MITAAAIVLYVLLGLATGRWTAIRRRNRSLWRDANEDDLFACAFAILFWPVAAALYAVTAPPRSERRGRTRALEQQRIREIEKELGL